MTAPPLDPCRLDPAASLNRARLDGRDARGLLSAPALRALAEAAGLRPDGPLRSYLDRSLASLSPVERVILLIGAYELSERPETPFKVVLNEAIELGKSFGGTDGYRFVNGVLEKIASTLRPDEVARSKNLA